VKKHEAKGNSSPSKANNSPRKDLNNSKEKEISIDELMTKMINKFKEKMDKQLNKFKITQITN
jgi:lipoate-protein ligase A